MDLVYSGELLLNLRELFSDQPSLLCQKKLILGGIVQKVNFEKLPPLTPPYTGGETAW